MRIGQRVLITGGTFSEFIGKTGIITDIEGHEGTVFYRVKPDEPVHIRELGYPLVDDTWEGRFLQII